MYSRSTQMVHSLHSCCALLPPERLKNIILYIVAMYTPISL